MDVDHSGVPLSSSSSSTSSLAGLSHAVIPITTTAEGRLGIKLSKMRTGESESESEYESDNGLVEWRQVLVIQRESNKDNCGGMDVQKVKEAVQCWYRDPAIRSLVERVKGGEEDERARQELISYWNEFEKALMAYLNVYWCVITKLSKPQYLDFVSLNGHIEPIHRSQRDFLEVYSTHFIAVWQGSGGGGGKSCVSVSKPLAKWWLENELRRECDGIVSYPPPMPTPPNFINLWQDMSITQSHCSEYQQLHPDYERQAQPFVHHILTIWCRGNRELFQYVMSWMAMTIQQPHIKLGVALNVVGGQGGGKGIVATHFLSSIVGTHHYAQVTGIEQLLHRFNASSSGKKLTLIDECTWGGSKADCGKLKSLITESSQYVEKKFMDGYHMNSLTNYLFFSNDSYCVSVEAQDRRFCSMEIDNRYGGTQTEESQAYFNQLLQVPVVAVACVLYEWDVVAFNPRHFPHTEFRQYQQVESLSHHTNGVAKWFLERLEKCELPSSMCLSPSSSSSSSSSSSTWTSVRRKEDVYEHYRLRGGQYAKPASVFWKELGSMCEYTTKQNRNTVPSIQLVQFAALTVCRNQFEKYMGTASWKWTEEEEKEETELQQHQ